MATTNAFVYTNCRTVYCHSGRRYAIVGQVVINTALSSSFHAVAFTCRCTLLRSQSQSYLIALIHVRRWNASDCLDLTSEHLRESNLGCGGLGFPNTFYPPKSEWGRKKTQYR